MSSHPWCCARQVTLFSGDCDGSSTEFNGYFGTTYSCGTFVADCSTYVVTDNGPNTPFSLTTCNGPDSCVDWTIGQYSCTVNNPSQPVFVTAKTFVFDLYCST